MGASGDMLNAALYDTLSDNDKARYISQMNESGIPGLTVSATREKKCEVVGSHIAMHLFDTEEQMEDVAPGHAHDHYHDHQHDHADRDHHHHDHTAHHHHDDGGHDHDSEKGNAHHHEHHEAGAHVHGMHLTDIEAVINNLVLPDSVKTSAIRTYALLATAEASVHGQPMDHIHFHEVGTLDAIADVVGFCLLVDLISPDIIMCSPIHVGSGNVRCAHGIVGVPAPATAELLKGIPTYGGTIQGELCTPTGAALMKSFATEFGPLPPMSVDAVGYGCGTKNFAQANVVRAFIGSTADTQASAENAAVSFESVPTVLTQEALKATDRIVELTCNIDDMTGEEISFAVETLMDAGALDTFVIPLYMKKGRPAHMICCLCAPAQSQEFAELMFKHTTTLGIRVQETNRYVLTRTEEQQDTEFGALSVKRSEGFGSSVAKASHDELAAIAKRTGLSLREIKRRLNL